MPNDKSISDNNVRGAMPKEIQYQRDSWARHGKKILKASGHSFFAVTNEEAKVGCFVTSDREKFDAMLQAAQQVEASRQPPEPVVEAT